MIKLHQTRLMRDGEVALWYRGKIIWRGFVGSHICDVTFDTVSMNLQDGERLSSRVGDETLTEEVALVALAEWWTGF